MDKSCRPANSKRIDSILPLVLLICSGFSVKMSQSPDGAVKLEIEHARPDDSGAYKLVISNPNGDNVALCAVAVKRMYRLDFTLPFV